MFLFAAALLSPSTPAVPPRLIQESSVETGIEAYRRGDYATALRLWRAAAAKGDADAQFNLGQAYKLGGGVAVDLAEAEKWYRLAALQGHAAAEENYGLVLFENGKRAAAVPWLERAIGRGAPRAQYLLGVMLFNGDGVAKDWVRAYALMTRAAAGGLEAGKQTLAEMDRYIAAADRTAGKALADRYQAQELAAAKLPSPPKPASTPKPAPAPKPAPKAAPVAHAAPAAPASGNWRVQLGAFATPGNAERLWGQVRTRFPDRQPFYVRSGQLTRLLVGPFPSRTSAEKACGALSPCVAVQH